MQPGFGAPWIVYCPGDSVSAPAKRKCFLAACVILAVTAIASADTLYLKNGMYIVVTKAAEKDGQVEYWVGSTKYTISKTLVTRVGPDNEPSTNLHSPNQAAPAIQDLSHRDSAPATTNAGRDKLRMPVPGGPKPNEPYWIALRSHILQGGPRQ